MVKVLKENFRTKYSEENIKDKMVYLKLNTRKKIRTKKKFSFKKITIEGKTN